MRELTVEERRKKNLELLTYLDSICREQHIEYSLTGGTLLGAIRHKGFIPWDDDVDVFLTRSEYERLNKYLESQDKYYWVTQNNDPNYYLNYGRLMDKHTHIVDEGIPKIGHYGLFIDVCVVDGLPDSFLLRMIHIWKIRFCYRARRCISLQNAEYIPKNLFKRFVKNIFRFVCGIFGIKWWMNRIDKLVKKYPFETGKYVGDVMSNYGIREVMHRTSFSHYIDTEFEGKQFRIICGWEEYLKNIYGDYMKLPPKDKRCGHCLGKVYWCE